MNIPASILSAYGLSPDKFSVQRVGSGHIHQTYRLSGQKTYILQRINNNVFKRPEVIARNLRAAADFLTQHHPTFIFLSAIKSSEGKELVYDQEGFPWRLFPYINNTITIDQVETSDEAYYAATEFARLTRLLDGIDLSLFQPTIERFHDLAWRWEQFEEASDHAKADRKKEANEAIHACKDFAWLVTSYTDLIKKGDLVLRIMHNDTKINNILFDATTRKAVCAIDLDTLMPGYFIYDLGDMIRTFVSPVNEEERDFTKIIFRESIYQSLVDGYLSQMEKVLNPQEIKAIPLGGLMMTYIMAMRMLTDFLNGDIYYHCTYPGQNLVRASNQFRLLTVLNKFFQIA